MEKLRDGLLLGIGNPLLDISATVDEKFLLKYCLKPNNAILAEPKHESLYPELIEKYCAEFIAGGSVQNSLRVAQWMMKVPNVAIFFGCVGNDDYAKLLEKHAHSNGVNTQYQFTDQAPTGTCAVLITGSNRSLVANLAAANHFTVDHIHNVKNRRYLENAEYFYISGFFLTASSESAIEVSKLAASRNKLLIMNLSAPFIAQFFKKQLADALFYTDILFGNESEAKTFAEENNFGSKTITEIALLLCKQPKYNEKRSRIVIITQGAQPVLLAQDDKVTEFSVKELTESEIVDTNGAGDAFVGGFLGQLVMKKSIDVCIRSGIWAAAQIIQRSGCTFEGECEFSG